MVELAPDPHALAARRVVYVAVLLALLIGLAAGVSPVLALGLPLAVAFVVVSLRSLAAGVALFVFLTFYDRAGESVGSSLTLSKLVGAVLMLLWVLVIASRGTRAPLLFRDDRLLTSLILTFAGWILASTLWAVDSDIGVANAVRLLQGLVLLLIVYTALQQRFHLRWLVLAFIGGSVVGAVLGLDSAAASSGDRISGGFDDPNELAAVIVPGIALAAFAFVALRGRPSRFLLILLLPILGLGLIRTDSQGGLVALAVAGVAAIVFGGPARRLAIVVAGSAVAFTTFWYTVVTTPVNLTEGGASREVLWKVAIHVARDHPFMGVGAGNLPVVEPRYALTNVSLARVDLVAKAEVAHNTYLHLLAEYGVIGVALFLGIVAAVFLSALRAIRTFAATGDREMELLARGVVVALCAILCAYFFISAQYEKQLWLLLGMAGSLRVVEGRFERARGRL